MATASPQSRAHGHPGTAGCGRAGSRDMGRPCPGRLHKQLLPNQICRPSGLCSLGYLRPVLNQGSDCSLLGGRDESDISFK